MKIKAFHFLYKTTCLITNKFYVGVHSTDDLFSKYSTEYLGSGLHLRAAVKKYGAQNFKREVLCLGPTRDYVIDLERRYVDQCLIDDPLCMNKAVGGLGGAPGVPKSEQHKDNIRKAISKLKITKATKRKISKGLKLSYKEGTKIAWNKGKHGVQVSPNKGHKGYQLSEETKKRMRGKRGPHKNPRQRKS